MPWLTMEDAAARLNQPLSTIERRVADGEIRTKTDSGLVLVFLPDNDAPTERSREIDSNRIAGAVERIVAAAQQLEDAADAQAEKDRFDAGIAATLDGAISHLQSTTKRRDFEARAKVRRAQLAERRARRVLRRLGAIAACVLLILIGWTISLESRYCSTTEIFRDDMAALAATMHGQRARLDEEYDALYALMEERFSTASDGVTAASDQITRIEAIVEQWRAEADRLQCELDQARAEYDYFAQALGILGNILQSGDHGLTLQEVLDETWGLKPIAPPLERESGAEPSGGLARR